MRRVDMTIGSRGTTALLRLTPLPGPAPILVCVCMCSTLMGSGQRGVRCLSGCIGRAGLVYVDEARAGLERHRHIEPNCFCAISGWNLAPMGPLHRVVKSSLGCPATPPPHPPPCQCCVCVCGERGEGRIMLMTTVCWCLYNANTTCSINV